MRKSRKQWRSLARAREAVIEGLWDELAKASDLLTQEQADRREERGERVRQAQRFQEEQVRMTMIVAERAGRAETALTGAERNLDRTRKALLHQVECFGEQRKFLDDANGRAGRAEAAIERVRAVLAKGETGPGVLCEASEGGKPLPLVVARDVRRALDGESHKRSDGR